MRLHALDSLRGIAALMVVFYHILMIYPDYFEILGGSGTSIYHVPEAWVAWLTLLPVRMVWAGREAVLFFFVLSGFVLTLAFLGPRPPGYVVFVIKRFCRLYLPFAVMIVSAALLWLAVGPYEKPWLSGWFADSWSEYPEAQVVLRHLLMTGSMSLNNVSWTLVVEWRVALIFPLLVMLARASLSGAIVVGLLLLFLHVFALSYWEFQRFYTLFYVIYFIFGILLAIHRPAVTAVLYRLSQRGRLGLWLAVYLLFNARWLTPWASLFADLANGVGATLLIAMVLTSPVAERLLTMRPLLWLGTISYSLYLVHVPVLMAMVYVLSNHLPLFAIVSLVAPAALAVAFVFYLLVEHPATMLARRAGGGRRSSQAAKAAPPAGR